MKKTCLTLCCVLAVAGITLSWLGNRMGGSTTASVHLFGSTWTVNAPFSGSGQVFDYGATPTRQMSAPAEQAVQLEEVPITGMVDESGTPFSSIDVDVDFGSVTILAGDNYGFSISCDNSSYQVDHWYEHDVLHIESRDDININLLAENPSCDIVISVPAGAELDEVWAELDLGDLTLAGLNIQNAELDLDLGSLLGEGLTVRGSLTADVDLGEVTLFGDLGESIEIDADLGGVYLGLSRPASEYWWELTADLGSARVDGKTVVTNNSATGGYGNRWISVDADLGSIEIDFNQDFSGDTPPAEAVGGTDGITYVFEGEKPAQVAETGE